MARKQNYRKLYGKSDYMKDENKFESDMKNGKIANWDSFKRLMISDLCTKTNIIETGYIGNIKLTDVDVALQNPKQRWRTLLAISETLMRISPHYYRLNKLYSNMPLFCWGVDLYDVKNNANVDTIKKAYLNLTSRLETMELKHEFSKIMNVLPYQDIFCGLIIENQTDFFIQQINFNICKLYEVQDGMYNFKINLANIKQNNLNAYPDYVQQAYLDFIDGKITNMYKPPVDKQICVKLNNQWTYPYPILIGLVRDILDLDLYKKLKLKSAKTDNYKAIMVKVPIDETTVNKPLLTPEVLEVFASINRESMDEDIGLIYNLGSTGEAISFKDSSNSRNNVSDAVDEVYNSSGITKEYFNGSASGTAVTFSVENDSGFIYGLYRQFERWINRWIKIRKYNKNTFKFRFYLLDTTIFNRDNVSSRYKDAATLGATVIDKWLASLDMTPSRILGSYILHKDIFDFNKNFIPLQSSFNSSSNDVGRPTNASKGEVLDVEGEKTANGEKNDY